jgi:hypothetical protein
MISPLNVDATPAGAVDANAQTMPENAAQGPHKHLTDPNNVVNEVASSPLLSIPMERNAKIKLEPTSR